MEAKANTNKGQPVNIYVNQSTGNDDNDGMSEGKAFKTITRGATECKKYVNINVILNISNGDYTNEGHLVIANMACNLSIKGAGKDITIINSIVFNQCLWVSTSYFTARSASAGVLVRYDGTPGYVDNCILDGVNNSVSGRWGLLVSSGGYALISGCAFNNLYYAVGADIGGLALLYATGNTGSGNTYRLYYGGGRIINEGGSISATNNHYVGRSVANESMQSLTTGNILPLIDNTYNIGSASLRWGNAYFGSSPVIGSDITLKEDIRSIDEQYINFLMSLNPVVYKFKDDENNKYLRMHAGFISNEVEQALYDSGLNTLDFAGYIDSPETQQIQVLDDTGNLMFDEIEQPDENGQTIQAKIPKMKTVIVGSKRGLRLEEFIAPIVAAIKSQQKQIEELRSQISAL